MKAFVFGDIPMYYAMHTMQRAMIWPWRLANSRALQVINTPANPWRDTQLNRTLVASGILFEQVTRRYGRPRFGSFSVQDAHGGNIDIVPKVVTEKPFGNLLHFTKSSAPDKNLPRVLIVAPMAGHFATLLRGTVERFLPEADVFVTEWCDAANVSVSEGDFGFFDYLEYMRQFMHTLGKDVHVVAVCQPTVPLYLLTAWMHMVKDQHCPRSLTLIGGPIDVNYGQTAITQIAKSHSLQWFKDRVIDTVPYPYPGFGRRVYPGFLQLTNFMAMNADRHMGAHAEIFKSLVTGDEETAQKRSDFYEEYRTVMDLSESFYLETLDIVFQQRKHLSGSLKFKGVAIDVSSISHTPLLVVEGERDDICGIGQTAQALELSTRLPREHRQYLLQKGVGHYGLFNGKKFRNEIAPRILNFIRYYQNAPL